MALSLPNVRADLLAEKPEPRIAYAGFDLVVLPSKGHRGSGGASRVYGLGGFTKTLVFRQ
jgi:hypothetical protein